MDIQKIKNYNQKMLAVITTAAVAFAIIGLFSFVVFLFTDVFRFTGGSRNYNAEEGIRSEEFDNNATEEPQQKLYVSYLFPQLVDTANQLFIIPVVHQTADNILNNYSDKISFSGLGSYDGYDYSYNAYYINLLVYDSKTGLHEKMFKQRIIIGEFVPVYFKDDILIVFKAAESDTDNNGMINLDDNSSLYLYSINNKTLKRAKVDNKSVLQHSFIATTKDLIVRFGERPNHRNKKDIKFDTGMLCKFDYASGQLVRINDEKLDSEIKSIAEGK